MILLDTHALIWWAQDSARLSAPARAAISKAAPNIFVSAASGYEVEFKERMGRSLGLPISLESIVMEEGFQPLPITFDHAARAATFAHPHRDPWDRLIAAQAMAEGLTVVTKDAEIAALGAKTVW